MPSSERREFGRVGQPFHASYRRYGDLMTSWRPIQTINISAGGLGFRSEDLFELESRVEFRLELPSMGQPLIVMGCVVASEQQPSGMVINGVQFVDMTPEQATGLDQLVTFLKQRAPGQDA